MVEPSKAPPVVCLCGSMRFHEAMHHVAVHESLHGRIVLMPHVDLRHPDYRSEVKNPHDAQERLGRLHKQKIDLADWVIVVTDTTRYLGDSSESTRSEIAYAESQGKPVWYWRWESTANGGDR